MSEDQKGGWAGLDSAELRLFRMTALACFVNVCALLSLRDFAGNALSALAWVFYGAGILVWQVISQQMFNRTCRTGVLLITLAVAAGGFWFNAFMAGKLVP